MNRYGPHAQSNNIQNWPQAVMLMRNGSWFKLVDDVGMAKDAKTANGSIKVVARFHRDWMQQFSLDENETRNRARDFINTWLNESFMEAAPYIDAVEDFNEYWAASHTPEQTAARVLWVQKLLQVWEDEILSDSRYDSLERIKWCLGNAAVGNDIPWQVAQFATEIASGPHYLGYHGYVSIVSKDYVPSASRIEEAVHPDAYREAFRVGEIPYHINPYPFPNTYSLTGSVLESATSEPVPGERSPDEFTWGSGRILMADLYEYQPRGLAPRYIITEGGLVRDENGRAHLMPNDGWNHSQVTDGDMDRYVELMGEVSDLYRTWNYNNGDRLEGYVFFTSGAYDWPGFLLNGEELTEIIDATADFEGTPTPQAPPEPIKYEVNVTDISHWQGELDGEISREHGNEFIIAKASDGFIMNPGSDDPLVDPTFAGFTKEAAAWGHLVGAYHFFQPSVSAARQALAFLRAMETVEQQNLPPALDLEATVNMPREQFQTMVLEWLNIVEDQTGQVPMLYTNVSYYDLWLSDPRFDRYPLWIANYDSHASMPSLPFRRHTWDFWQWTSEGNGGANGVASADIDLDRFNESLAVFLENYSENWLAPSTPPPPPPTPDPCEIREQYVRVVHVIPSDVTAEQKQYVFDSVSNNLQTITFSYDDAGATPCLDNTAVLWYIDEDDRPEFEAWFAEFYPDTKLAFVGVRSNYAGAPTTTPLLFLPWWKKVLLRLRRYASASRDKQ